mmetsp:Transcript_22466/g.89192  ORF Transcript_22466/g.89192 Transcript_22466/m.89192 type:complete len:108 (-) Transcript_22466:353-676(-)
MVGVTKCKRRERSSEGLDGRCHAHKTAPPERRNSRAPSDDAGASSVSEARARHSPFVDRDHTVGADGGARLSRLRRREATPLDTDRRREGGDARAHGVVVVVVIAYF